MLTALAGGWVGLAVWLVVARGGRSAATVVRGRQARRGAWAWARRRSGTSAGEGNEVRVAVAQVVALLRAGAPPAAAWTRALGVPVDAAGLPGARELAPVVGGEAHARSVVAAARLAGDVGAPLGGVLDAVSGALVAEAEARAEREASLAGPQATARVLMWLPVLGALLGWVLGADPVATATDGGAGTAVVSLGVLLLAAGRVWTGRLVATARAAGEEAS
ncbi:hypothetical protein [Isoptericola hypogeus]|uniref:hypothetical protein n=1 Tax=Isoptericola hypogeus TaxID=300179 RepID=UPI0031CFC49C